MSQATFSSLTAEAKYHILNYLSENKDLPHSCWVSIPLYFLSLYNGGIDAQNTHFQSNKSQNELHFLKYSSIFSFWAKIKRPSVLQPTVKQVYGTEKFIFSIRNDIIILFAL